MKGNEGATSQAVNNVIGGVGGGAKKKRKGGNSSSSASVFEQMVGKLPSLTPESLLLPHRVWKVKFVGKFVGLRHLTSKAFPHQIVKLEVVLCLKKFPSYFFPHNSLGIDPQELGYGYV